MNENLTQPAQSPEANKMPAVFVGHGSPMNSLEHNRFTQAWADFGQSCPRPKAILAISAHWYRGGTAVTAMVQPRTIHDFGGFPEELSAVQYRAPGQPELAGRVADIFKPTSVQLDTRWGLDHGTWSVLTHMYPEAEIPVVQLSVDANASIGEHMRLGAALEPLRHEGVLIVASGNVVHNLRLIEWKAPEAAFNWAAEFDDATLETMTTTPELAAQLSEHRQYNISAPTPEHFLPLLYIAGLGATAGTPAEVLVRGHAMGSISMTSYVIPGQ